MLCSKMVCDDRRKEQPLRLLSFAEPNPAARCNAVTSLLVLEPSSYCISFESLILLSSGIFIFIFDFGKISLFPLNEDGDPRNPRNK